MPVVSYVGYALGALGVLGTLLPLVPNGKPAFRVWDFPRSQLAAVLALALAAAAPALPAGERVDFLYVAALLGCLLWQGSRILPYTPLFRHEAKGAEACADGRSFRLMSSNVLRDNRNADRLLSLVRERRPDILLLVETDDWWDAVLKPLDDEYRFCVRHPQGNFYGMHLFSKFELVDPHVRFLVDDDIPSIKTGVRLPSGDLVRLYGVHPQPPPIVDSEERDAELLLVAKEVAESGEAAIVAGDLNDVAWSPSTHRFQKVSGLVDPRVGRGLYSTFDASKPWFLRWPLDHVFFSPAFRLLEVGVSKNIGSDHFPFVVALCYEPASGPPAAPTADAEELDAADDSIKKGIEKAKD